MPQKRGTIIKGRGYLDAEDVLELIQKRGVIIEGRKYLDAEDVLVLIPIPNMITLIGRYRHTDADYCERKGISINEN